MRKLLTLAFITFSLSGCIMSGPMAFLPPTAKFIMWAGDDNSEQDSTYAISVEQLLNNARGRESQKDENSDIAHIRIPYDTAPLSSAQFAHLENMGEDSLQMICGPYEYSDPLNAALLALRSCKIIQRQLSEKGLTTHITFQANAPKGEAVITPIVKIGETDA